MAHFLAALPSYQQLQGMMGDTTWPDRVWLEATEPLPAASAPQTASEQARVQAVAAASAAALSAPPPNALLAAPSPRVPRQTVRSANEETVAEWFAHWRRLGSMGLVQLVPEPMRSRYPHDGNPALHTEDDEAIAQCLLHFLAWSKK